MSVKDIPQKLLEEAAKYLNRFVELKPGEDEEDQARYFELMLAELKEVDAKFQYTNVEIVDFGFDNPSLKLLCDLQRKELCLDDFVRCLRKIKCTGALNIFRAATTPVVKSQPDALTVKQGETIVLTVDAECQPGKPIFQWFNAKKLPLPDQKSRSLIIHNANGAHTGVYNCRVTNPFINNEQKANVFSKWIPVTVVVPEAVESVPRQETIDGQRPLRPTITHHPSPITTYHGSSVVMECVAEDGVFYEWYRNGHLVKKGCSNGRLEIDPVSMEDAGEYECIAINDGGKKHSKTAKLTVETGIVITEQPGDINVRAGDDLILHCTAESRNGQDLLYKWFRRQGSNEVFEQEGSTLKCKTHKDGSYWKQNTAKTRKYLCKVAFRQRPEIGISSKKATVTINTVWFIDQPKELNGTLGQRAYLMCTADGVHDVSYMWLTSATKGGKMEKVTGLKTARNILTFEKMKQKHLGYYQCQAQHNLEFAESEIIQVSAKPPGRMAPVITFLKEPWSWVRQEGERLRLVCEAETSSDAPLRYQWFRNGEEIREATDQHYIVERVTKRDYADYYCEVSTHNGLSKSPSKPARVAPPCCQNEEEPVIVGKSGKQLEQREAERKLLMGTEERYAREKVALLIGNQTYESDDIENLGSPEHDIAELRDLLESLDFKVISLIDLTFEDMMQALDRFYEMLKISGVYALFYYSGHGFNYTNNTFLMPVDATLPLNTQYNVHADDISAKMQGRLSRALLVLDCCQVEPEDTMPEPQSLTTAKNFSNRIVITSCFNQQRAYDGDMEPLGVVDTKPARQLRPSSSCSDFNMAFRAAISKKTTVQEAYHAVLHALVKAGVGGSGDSDQRPDYKGAFFDDRITLHDRVMLDDPKIEDDVDKMMQLHKLACFVPEPVFIDGEELGDLAGIAKLELKFSGKYSNVLLMNVYLHLLNDKAALISVDCDQTKLEKQGLTLSIGTSSTSETANDHEMFSLVQQTVHKISGLQRLKGKLELAFTLSVCLSGEEKECKVTYELPRNPLFANLLHTPSQ